MDRLIERLVHHRRGRSRRTRSHVAQRDHARGSELLAKVDGWLLDATPYVVEQYRTEVGRFIADTVRGWDPEATSRKIELAVGRDLQFIRINGTIMGALVGLILYLIGLTL